MSIEPALHHMAPARDLPLVPSHDDIDLRLLLVQLWRDKKTIIGFTIVTAILSLVMAFMLPQKWTSKAVLAVPESIQVNNLEIVIIQLRVLGVDIKGNRSDIFNLFIKKLSSQSQFQHWLRQSKMLNDSSDPVTIEYELNRMAESLTIVNNADPKKVNEQLPYVSWTVSFTGSKQEQAQQILSGFLDFISQQVRKEVLETLRSSIDKTIRNNQESLELNRTHLENARSILIQRLKYSLSIANAAGVQKPLYSQGMAVRDDPDFSISLGAAGIAEKLKIESSLKNVSDLNSDLQNSEYTLKKLQSLSIPDVNFIPVTFQLSPTLPLKKDGPGKVLILVLSSMLGSFLGCGYVLVKQLFKV